MTLCTTTFYKFTTLEGLGETVNTNAWATTPTKPLSILKVPPNQPSVNKVLNFTFEVTVSLLSQQNV